MGEKIRQLVQQQWAGLIALFLVLSGGTALANHEDIFSNDIVDGEVKTVDIASNAVTSARINNGAVQSVDVLNNSLTGEDVLNNSLSATDIVAGTFQRSRVRIDAPDIAGGDPVDFTPDVANTSVLVFDYNITSVMGTNGEPSFTGGREGQRLTLVSLDEPVIFTEVPDLVLEGSGGWSGDNGDSLTLVLADGIWYETARSNNG